jgi:trehalose 6-phosphate phosphatase
VLRTFRGDQVIEIVPEVDWNKGRCALWIWSRVGPKLPRPAMMLYMGDDWTDELAFRTLAGKAVTVRVGRPGEPTLAGYRLAEVHQVLRLLSALAEELEERGEP